MTVTVPPLAQGLYRVGRSHSSGLLVREFWVTDDVASPPIVSPSIPDTWVPTGPVAFDVVRRGADETTLVVGLTGADEAWPEANLCWQGYTAVGQVVDGVVHITVTTYRSTIANEGPCVCPDDPSDQCSPGRGARKVEVHLDQPPPPEATIADDGSGRTDVPFINVAVPVPTYTLIAADDRYILVVLGPQGAPTDELIALAESLTPFPIAVDAPTQRGPLSWLARWTKSSALIYPWS